MLTHSESLKDTTESMMRQSKRATDIEREFIKSQQEKVDLEAKVLAYEKRIKELGDADATAAEKSEALSQKVVRIKQNADIPLGVGPRRIKS